jgi:23S rRNA pseudouridine1911/1915/1917 synthase
VLYEDTDLIVIVKPAGMVVHAGAGHATGTLVNALLAHCRDLSGIGGVLRPGIVHRLDKDTSGVMVAAKNDLAHRALAVQFERHSVERRYDALVWGGFRAPAGTLEGTLAGEGRHAVTHYRVLEATPHFAQVACTLETGRTHQIRVQLSEAGHPVVGDRLYGKSRSLSPRMGPGLRRAIEEFGRQALHAAVLGFTLPGGKAVRFEAPPPADHQNLWRLMREEDLS